MRDAYERILTSLFDANDLRTPEEQGRYLEGLRPAAVRLWQAYQQQQGIGQATHYDQAAIQAAYMLRYFPSYTQPIVRTVTLLAAFGDRTLDQETVRAVFFGSGPAPELHGLLRVLRTRFPAARRIVAHLFDIASTTWQPSREIIVNHLLPLIWAGGHIEVNASTFDVSHPDALQHFGGQQVVAGAHLAVFQNCLNEIPVAAHATVRANVLQILRAMPRGSVMTIIERAKYPAVAALLAENRQTGVDEGVCNVLMGPEERAIDCAWINDAAPQIVLEKLFVKISTYRTLTDNEYGRVLSRYVAYVCMALART